MHPDKSDDPNAHEKFSEITRIYETLKDDELRKKYDRHGFISIQDNLYRLAISYESYDMTHGGMSYGPFKYKPYRIR